MDQGAEYIRFWTSEYSAILKERRATNSVLSLFFTCLAIISFHYFSSSSANYRVFRKESRDDETRRNKIWLEILSPQISIPTIFSPFLKWRWLIDSSKLEIELKNWKIWVRWLFSGIQRVRHTRFQSSHIHWLTIYIYSRGGNYMARDSHYKKALFC